MKYIFYALLFVVSLLANESEVTTTIVEENLQELTTQESSVFDEENSDTITEVKPSTIDYFDEVHAPAFQTEKNIYLSYSHFPKKVYKNQRFEVVVKTIITTNEYDRIETRFINSKNMTVLNADSQWVETGEKTYENRFYFKAYEKVFRMPTFQVVLYRLGSVVEVAYLQPNELEFTQIAQGDKKFSLVIANELKVNAHKTKQYNNDELITILDLEGYESNLEDFMLEGINEQGISSITDNYPEQNILYYLVIPVHKKKIEFNYYNTQENRLVKMTIPVVLENELVSTQTDLNPNKSDFLLYKKIALGVIVALFLILYIWKRNYLYLILSLLALVFLLMYMMPNQTKTLKANSNIYILPTKNSTIFRKTNKDYNVEVSIQKAGFVKVIFYVGSNSMIGWVKEEDLVKN